MSKPSVTQLGRARADARALDEVLHLADPDGPSRLPLRGPNPGRYVGRSGTLQKGVKMRENKKFLDPSGFPKSDMSVCSAGEFCKPFGSFPGDVTA